MAIGKAAFGKHYSTATCLVSAPSYFASNDISEKFDFPYQWSYDVGAMMRVGAVYDQVHVAYFESLATGYRSQSMGYTIYANILWNGRRYWVPYYSEEKGFGTFYLEIPDDAGDYGESKTYHLKKEETPKPTPTPTTKTYGPSATVTKINGLNCYNSPANADPKSESEVKNLATTIPDGAIVSNVHFCTPFEENGVTSYYVRLDYMEDDDYGFFNSQVLALWKKVDVNGKVIEGLNLNGLTYEEHPDIPSDGVSSSGSDLDPLRNENSKFEYKHDADWMEMVHESENPVQVSEYAKLLAETMENTYGDQLSKYTMRLFGLPYQFLPSVDTREDDISDRIGIQFMKNMLVEGPIVTITPGKPKYLGNSSGDKNAQQALLMSLKQFSEMLGTKPDETTGNIKSDEQLRYYDFEQDYLRYMQYVDMMCRSAAALLGIDGKRLDGCPLSQYSWKNYRFTSAKYVSETERLGTTALTTVVRGAEAVGGFFSSMAKWAGEKLEKAYEALTGKGDNSKIRDADELENQKVRSMSSSVYPNSPENVGSYSVTTGEPEPTLIEMLGEALSTNMNYVQFYMAPDTFSENLSNSTMQSSIVSQLVEKASTTTKEIRFLTNSLAGDKALEAASNIASMADSAVEGLNQAFSGGFLTDVMSRIASVGKHVIAGDTMVFPEIFDRSEYSKNYSINIALKTPYGDKYSYYMNILVPLCHLIALTAPKQTTANTYSSPFLVRAFVPGQWNCNLGIIDSLEIRKGGANGSLSVDGYPLEVDVTLRIKDLYSDLMIAPTTDPFLFLGNQGLVDFLAVNCGLDLTIPNYDAKFKLTIDSVKQAYLFDVGENMIEAATNTFDNALKKLLNSWSIC